MQASYGYSLQYDPGGGAALMGPSDLGPPRIDTFGVLRPDILLILCVSHLNGKLKPSRLAPEGWHGREVWQSAIQIGGGCCKIFVADVREELYSNGHMAGIGFRKMIRGAYDFINLLEDEEGCLEWPRERLTANMFVDFLSVVLPVRA